MELIDKKTQELFGPDELKKRIVAAARLTTEKNVSVSLGKVTEELCAAHGLAIVRKEVKSAGAGQKVVIGPPEKDAEGFIRRASIISLSQDELDAKAAKRPADLSAVSDPVLKAIALKIGLTQGDVDAQMKEVP